MEKLDEFLNLYKKVKDKDNFHVVGAGPFLPGPSHDQSLTYLNSFRNEFIHFTPKGWSLLLQGLPRVCLDALDLMQFFGWESTAILWHKQVLVVRAKRALKRLRRTLVKVEAQYGGYDLRQRLLSTTVGGQTTAYDYEPTGDLKKVTQPGGSWVAYSYDAARRLTGVSDSAGHSIVYTLDNAGNRTKEEVKDPTGALSRQLTRVYDALGRVQQTTGRE